MYKNLILLTVLITIFMIGISITAKYNTTPSSTVKSNEKVISTPKQTVKSYNDNIPKAYNTNEEVVSTLAQTTNLYNAYTPPTYNANDEVISKSKQTTSPDEVCDTSNYDAQVEDTQVADISRAVGTLSYYYTQNWAYTGGTVEQIIRESSLAYPAKLVATRSAHLGGGYPKTIGICEVHKRQGAGMIPGLVRELDEKAPTSTKKIIFIAESGEICYDSDCTDTNNVVAEGNDIIIDVIFIGDRNKNLNLNCLTCPTGGTIYIINDDINEFEWALRKSMATTKKNKNCEQVYSSPCSRPKPKKYGIIETEHKF